MLLIRNDPLACRFAARVVSGRPASGATLRSAPAYYGPDLRSEFNPALLVIGYGNELRRDDGLGPALARRIENLHLPGVQVMTGHQLTPELADSLSHVKAAVFIDAVCNQQTVQVKQLSCRKTTDLRPHFSQPEQLLALTSHLFGRSPRAWMITMPAFDLGFGEGLSEQGQAAAEAALLAFQRWANSLIRLPSELAQ